ncbi:MAG: NHLP leader peptide family RiPP precursor [Acidobacteriota bacterium]
MKIESRGELQDVITKNAATDDQYRNKLLADPKEVLEKHLQRDLPDWLQVEVVQEQANKIYLVAPHVPSDELSDDDLEMVAGGKGEMVGGDVECRNNYGAFNSVVNIQTEVGLF